MKETHDLLGHLARDYNQAQRKAYADACERAGLPADTVDISPLLEAHLKEIWAFVDWVRGRLRKNPVIGVYPVSSGLGLRFQDGTCVPFTEQPPERPMRDECVHVTNPGFNPSTDFVASPECMPITGGRETGK